MGKIEKELKKFVNELDSNVKKFKEEAKTLDQDAEALADKYNVPYSFISERPVEYDYNQYMPEGFHEQLSKFTHDHWEDIHETEEFKRLLMILNELDIRVWEEDGWFSSHEC